MVGKELIPDTYLIIIMQCRREEKTYLLGPSNEVLLDALLVVDQCHQRDDHSNLCNIHWVTSTGPIMALRLCI